jgi:hypothetical protein
MSACATDEHHCQTRREEYQIMTPARVGRQADDVTLARKSKETTMLSHELLRDKGILLVRPQGLIQAGDFETIARLVDPYIEQTGGLRGIMVEASSFPGWDSFGALISHLKFVRNHHQLVAKIAAVSDSAVLTLAPQIAKHFVKAEFRHFNANDSEAALAWLDAK